MYGIILCCSFMLQVVDLQTQLRHFGDLENRYKQNLGDTEARKLLSNAVYLFSSGANDYITFSVSKLSIYSNKLTNRQYTDMVIGNLTKVIKVIIDCFYLSKTTNLHVSVLDYAFA